MRVFKSRKLEKMYGGSHCCGSDMGIFFCEIQSQFYILLIYRINNYYIYIYTYKLIYFCGFKFNVFQTLFKITYETS